MPRSIDLSEFSVHGLLSLYADVLTELRGREVIRTSNNPVADYAEYLAAKALGLALAPRSTTGYDAEDGKGLRYEVKSRRVTKHNSSRLLSAIRGLDAQHFDFQDITDQILQAQGAPS